MVACSALLLQLPRINTIFLCDFLGHGRVYTELIDSVAVYSCDLADLVPLRGLVGGST